MKNVFTYLFFLVSFHCLSQYKYYDAILISNSGSEEKVFLKTKAKVLKDQAITIFDLSKNKVTLSANDFSTLKSDELELVVAQIPELSNKKIILRKLSNTKPFLFSYEGADDKTIFLIKRNDQFEVLRNDMGSGSSDYKKYFFNNLNSQNRSPAYFAELNYSKNSLAEYLYPEKENSLLKQEPEVDFLDLYLTAGYMSSNFSINFTRDGTMLNDTSTNNYFLRLTGQFNLSQISNKISILAGFNYSSPLTGEGTYTRRENVNDIIEETYSLRVKYSSIFIGPQYNFHLNTYRISPYFLAEPLFLSENSDALIIERSTSSLSDITVVSKRTNPIKFSLGLIINYNDTLQIDASYGFASEPYYVMTEGNTFMKFDTLSVGLGYKIL